MNKTIVLIASLLFLPFPTFAVETSSHTVSQRGVETSSCEIKAEKGETGEYSEKQLQTLAKRITVRVIGDNNGGSGTLLAKKGNTYLVITNSHVVRGVNRINLQTSDGKTYPAQILPNTNFDKFDLALLQFQTNQTYCLTEVANFITDTDKLVLAAGYSSEKGQIVFRPGKVQQISERPLKEGYQIGYTSDIEQGMSGGAILNSVGQMIGINGRSAYPILNTGYAYPDGSRPTEEEIKQMRSVSWGIPVSTFLAQVNGEILTAYGLPLPVNSIEVPPTQLSGWLGELESKAKQFTVRIDILGDSEPENGSGIIIAQEGNTYTVLTAAHVVCKRQKGDKSTKPCLEKKYEIVAHDGKKYPVDKSTIKTEEGVDLGVVKFTSKQNYKIATLANYNPNNNEFIFTAGYPKLANNSLWQFTIGRAMSKEQGLIQLKDSDFKNDGSEELQSYNSLTGGYELVYTSITYGGMSGGPVLDSLGRVIGIHGRVEGEEAEFGVNDGKAQMGYSLGVPVSTFLGLKVRFNVKPQYVDENPKVPKLDAQKVRSIEKAILSTNVSKGNATATQWLERGNQLWRLNRNEEAVKAFDESINLKPSYLAYYGKGSALFYLGKYQDAVDAFEKVMKYKHDYVPAWLLQSAAYRYFNQLDKALEAIDKAIQYQPKNPNLYNQKSALLRHKKRYADSELLVKEAIKLNPRPIFFANLGNIYSDQQKWDLALDAYKKAIDLNPHLAVAYHNRGNLYRDRHKWDLALANYNKAIDINPQYVLAYQSRAFFYSQRKNRNLALIDYNTVIQLNPQNALAYIHRAMVYFQQKKRELAFADFDKGWELALANYNKAIQLNPQDVLAYISRALVYGQQKKWDLALADYNKAIDINPDDAKIYYSRGIFYGQQQKQDLALADYNKAIDLDPEYAEAYENRGILYYDQQKWNLALADYTKVIVLNPLDADGYYNRGLLYTKQQKWDLALADFNKIIDINPQYAESYNNRGVLYTKQQKWDLALADYNKAIDLDPEYAESYYNRGIFYGQQQKQDLALADYNKAIDLDPEYAEAYKNRGILYYKQQKLNLALTDYNKLIDINPLDADAYYNRGLLYYSQQKWDLALADYNKAIDINPLDTDFYNNRGLLYYSQQKWDLALADINKAIQLKPINDNAYYNRGNIYYYYKNWNLAIADYSKAIDINHHFSEAYDKRGQVYYNQQKLDLALTDFNKAISVNSQYAEAYFHRGIINHKQQQWDLALADYNKVIELNPKYLAAINNIGLIKYEQGTIETATREWQQVIALNSKAAEPLLALAVALHGKGEKEKAYQLAETALRLDKNFADVTVLKENLWGERLINDVQKLLSSPQIQTLRSQLR